MLGFLFGSHGEPRILERKHVQADCVIYIGKKANNINEQTLDLNMAQEFINKQEIMDKIYGMSQKQALTIGFSKSRFQEMKYSKRNYLKSLIKTVNQVVTRY
ncbi:hypothetical protein RE476_04300 [Methanolobus mangrovi]|uniref:Uncharacterized protein n=1 Tax=Methanolobus mangrovi TaxID=3072977 RepID=A0AA51YJX7_9EURY|nr:hypothetical protein [Methanolobus mangrovi]WMW23058.1 hypothetical protein RE476_04300 [Methanolobus mangrovi]